jgi:hypothetical protein
MSTQKIILPDFVIANLYGNNLVVESAIVSSEKIIEKTASSKVPKAEQKKVITEVNKKWYLGNNGKQITIIVKELDAAYINDQHLQFLSNILTACKLNLGDIALVNLANTPLLFTEIEQKNQPKFLILFDISPNELVIPLAIQPYDVVVYNNCQMLLAPALSAMDGDSIAAKTEKGKLWMSLKKMFQL